MANNTSGFGKRSQEESIRTQERILDEAERLFARVGLGVSIREIAKAAGVRHNTLQHHFGDKMGLYKAVLNRWDSQLEQELISAINGLDDLGEIIDTAIEALFDFLLSKRDWVKLTSPAATEMPSEVRQLQQKGWVQFIEAMFTRKSLGPLQLDPRLLFITVEGITHNHVLAQEHYMALFGKDVTDKALNRKTKEHVKTVVRSLLGAD